MRSGILITKNQAKHSYHVLHGLMVMPLHARDMHDLKGPLKAYMATES